MSASFNQEKRLSQKVRAAPSLLITSVPLYWSTFKYYFISLNVACAAASLAMGTR